MRCEAVTVLAGGDEPAAVGRDGEAARDFHAGGCILDERHFSIRGDGEDGDAVVAAVRDVHEFSVRVAEDFRGAVLVRVRGVGRQGADRLDGGERAFRGVVREGGDVAGHLVAHVGEAAFRVKGEVPRAAAGRHFSARRIVRRERALRGVEAVDEDVVRAEVACVREAAVYVDRVCVRAFLAPRVRARADVLHGGRCGCDGAVVADGERGDAAAVVVCREDGLAARLDEDVAIAGAF